MEMEMEVTKEMLDKATGAKSPQELLELAKAEGIELTEEAAKEAFAKLHPESGELSDEELENVAGGAVITKLRSGYDFSDTWLVEGKTNEKMVTYRTGSGWC